MALLSRCLAAAAAAAAVRFVGRYESSRDPPPSDPTLPPPPLTPRYPPGAGEAAEWEEEDDGAGLDDDSDDEAAGGATDSGGWFSKTRVGSFLASATGNKVLIPEAVDELKSSAAADTLRTLTPSNPDTLKPGPQTCPSNRHSHPSGLLSRLSWPFIPNPLAFYPDPLFIPTPLAFYPNPPFIPTLALLATGARGRGAAAHSGRHAVPAHRQERGVGDRRRHLRVGAGEPRRPTAGVLHPRQGLDPESVGAIRWVTSDSLVRSVGLP